MAATEYKGIFTDNTKTALKADTINLIKRWFFNHIQKEMMNHAAASVETQAMKTLLKTESSKIVAMWITSDYERVDNRNDLKDCMNHVYEYSN